MMASGVYWSQALLMLCAIMKVTYGRRHVTIHPKLETGVLDKWVLEGRHMTLTCVAEGYTEAEVTWFTESGANIKDKVTSSHNASHVTLIFTKEVSADDSDLYMCQATSGLESDLKEIRIKVLVVYTRDVNITEGADTTLDCDPQNDFSWTTSWLLNGAFLRDIPTLKDRLEFQEGGSGNSGSSVTIRNSRTNDSAIYTCRVELVTRFTSTKPIQSASTRFDVDVIAYGRPFMREGYSKTNRADGEMTLTCPVGGQPRPEVFWFYKGKVIDSDASSKYRMGDFKGVAKARLKITNLTKTDEGQYRCTAESDRGKADLTINLDLDPTPTSAASSSAAAAASLMLIMMLLMIILK